MARMNSMNRLLYPLFAIVIVILVNGWLGAFLDYFNLRPAKIVSFDPTSSFLGVSKVQ